MGRVQSGNALRLRAERIAEHTTKTIPAVADGKQSEIVVGSRFLPTARDGLCGLSRGERALEFVRRDKDSHRRVREFIALA